MDTAQTESDARLVRAIGLRGATLLVITNVIGSAIFLTPGSMAATLPSEALLLTGDSCDELGQRDKAKKAYESAIKTDDKNAEATFKLGRAAEATGNYTQAAPLLERSVALLGPAAAGASWSPEAVMLAGDTRRKLGDNAAAIASYTRYLELARPDAPERRSATQALARLRGNVKTDDSAGMLDDLAIPTPKKKPRGRR